MHSKEQIKGNLMLSLESTNARMSRNGKNELLLGKHRSLDEIIETVNRVDIMSVNELIQHIFTDEYAVSLISPEENLSSTIPELKCLL